MNILLILPVPPRQYWPRGMFCSKFVPTGLAYVGSALKQAGHNVLIHNREEQFRKCGQDWAATDALLLKLLHDFLPQMVGLSVMTPGVPEAAWIARQVKAICGPGTVVVAGGVHPTAAGDDMMEAIPEIDIAVIGEGEQTMIELAAGTNPARVSGIIHRRDGQCLTTVPRPPEPDLDRLTPIDYSLLDMNYHTEPSRWLIRWLELPALNLRTSRGCTNRCRFCTGHLVNGVGVRFHSVDRVVSDMQQAADRFQVRGIHFEDDTLGADPNRLVALCEAIRRRGLERRLCWDGCLRVDQASPELLGEMKAAGCIQVEYGFESASDPVLKRLGKGATSALNRQAVEQTRRAGLRIYADIMVGLPGETRADLQATEDFLRWAAPEVISFGCMAPLPGSALYKELPEQLRQSLNFGELAYMEGSSGINLTAMSDAEWARAYRELNHYFVKPWLQRQLLQDTPPGRPEERDQLSRKLRRFRWRHPIRYARLPNPANRLKEPEFGRFLESGS